MSGTRTRTRAVSLLAALTLALAGCSTTAPPRADDRPTVPLHWRTETFRDVQLAVPGYWDYGVTGHQWCARRGPGHAGRPYVGRPGALAEAGCGLPSQPDAAFSVDPGGVFVWFATEAAPASPARRGDRATLRFGDVYVVVQAPDALRNRILATIHPAKTDAHGCPTTATFGPDPDWRPPPGVPVTELTGVEVVSACRYVVQAGVGTLDSSIELQGRAAASAIAAVAATPVGAGPKAWRSCRPSPSYEGDVFSLQVSSRQGESRLVMRYETCTNRGFDDGHDIRALTRRSVAPFTAPPNTIWGYSGDLAGVL